MNKAQSFITENFGKYNNGDLDKYIELGGYNALKKVITKGGEFVVEELKASGLKGRGGAAYPTWKKWQSAKSRCESVKYVLCNADEGEPGTFKDRDLLSKDPFKIIEGLTIAGITVGAKEGFIYIREEYDYIQKTFKDAINTAKKRGLVGKNILDSGFSFNLKVYTGAGAYVCGENTALIESMHGRVGRPRIKPPRVGEKGLFDKPTMVNNVETYACVTTILNHGSRRYLMYGTEQSKGTKLISLCGNIKKPGTYEVPFGISIREIINDIGGGTKENSQVKFLQAGGASGPLIPESMFDIKYTYEDFEAHDFQIDSGSIVVADENIRVIDYLLAVQDFFYHESCGKCTPCREGKRQLAKILKTVSKGEAIAQDLRNIEHIAKIMKHASFCGLGQTAPTATLSAIKYFTAELCKDVDGVVHFENGGK